MRCAQLILSGIVLYEGSSPAQPVNLERRQAQVTATTFDCYVPVFSPWSSFVDQDPSASKYRAQRLAKTRAAPPEYRLNLAAPRFTSSDRTPSRRRRRRSEPAMVHRPYRYDKRDDA